LHDLRDEVEDELADRCAEDWRTAGLDVATTALLEFAEKLTIESAGVDDADIERLRAAGHDDEAISSCVQVVAYFNYINRIADGLGVPPEAWLGDDGRPLPDQNT
jgi:uncharacterized peroxidase-related enzyme